MSTSSNYLFRIRLLQSYLQDTSAIKLIFEIVHAHVLGPPPRPKIRLLAVLPVLVSISVLLPPRFFDLAPQQPLPQEVHFST